MVGEWDIRQISKSESEVDTNTNAVCGGFRHSDAVAEYCINGYTGKISDGYARKIPPALTSPQLLRTVTIFHLRFVPVCDRDTNERWKVVRVE